MRILLFDSIFKLIVFFWLLFVFFWGVFKLALHWFNMKFELLLCPYMIPYISFKFLNLLFIVNWYLSLITNATVLSSIGIQNKLVYVPLIANLLIFILLLLFFIMYHYLINFFLLRILWYFILNLFVLLYNFYFVYFHIHQYFYWLSNVI